MGVIQSLPEIGSIWKYYSNDPDYWITFEVTSNKYEKSLSIDCVKIKYIDISHWRPSDTWHLNALNIDHWIKPENYPGMSKLELLEATKPIKYRNRFELIRE